MTKQTNATYLWVSGDRVVYKPVNAPRVPQWRDRVGKLATVVNKQLDPISHVLVTFDGESAVRVVVRSDSLAPAPDNAPPAPSPPPKTLHDEAREQFELAMTYAEDGAIATAAFMLEQIAQEYRKRANMILAEIEGKTHGRLV